MDGIETPTIDRCVESNVLAASRAHREFRMEHRMWLEAYKRRDVQKMAQLAKTRDLKAKKAAIAYRKADEFLIGLAGLLEVRY